MFETCHAIDDQLNDLRKKKDNIDFDDLAKSTNQFLQIKSSIFVFFNIYEFLGES